MQVFIKDIDSKFTQLEVSPDTLVKSLKRDTFFKYSSNNKSNLPLLSNIPIILVYNGTEMEDHETLAKYGVKNEDTIHMVFKLRP